MNDLISPIVLLKDELRTRARIRRSIPRAEPDRIADVCERAADRIDALEAIVARAEQDAQQFRRVMALLRDTKLAHGFCQPRARRACTHCDAVEQIDEMLASCKGAPVMLA